MHKHFYQIKKKTDRQYRYIAEAVYLPTYRWFFALFKSRKTDFIYICTVLSRVSYLHGAFRLWYVRSPLPPPSPTAKINIANSLDIFFREVLQKNLAALLKLTMKRNNGIGYETKFSTLHQS